jgi:hypothetical protein
MLKPMAAMGVPLGDGVIVLVFAAAVATMAEIFICQETMGLHSRLWQLQ